MTAVLTILPLLLWFALVLPTCRKEAGSGLLSKDNSVSLKGLCSVVIIYVHIPALFGNTLQDAVGSFAYICVTLFFCYSAYGMTLNVEKKDDYLRCFWRNRLASLLVPCLLVNVAAFLTDLSVNRNPDFRILYEINPYVVVLLEWCVAFFIVHMLRRRFCWSNTWSDVILIILVVIPSLAYYVFFESKNVQAWWGQWCYERLGLVWGLLMCRYSDSFSGWLSRHNVRKIVFFLFLSLILGIGYVRFKTVFFWGAYALKVILGLSSIVLLSLLLNNIRIGSAMSSWLGRISYEVYLCQFIVLATLPSMLQGCGSGLFVSVSVSVTVIVAAAINAVSSRIIPLIRS